MFIGATIGDQTLLAYPNLGLTRVQCHNLFVAKSVMPVLILVRIADVNDVRTSHYTEKNNLIVIFSQKIVWTRQKIRMQK